MESSATSWTSANLSGVDLIGSGRGGGEAREDNDGSSIGGFVLPTSLSSELGTPDHEHRSLVGATTPPAVVPPIIKNKKPAEVSIFWDYESVPIPSGASAATVTKALVAKVTGLASNEGTSSTGGAPAVTARIVDRRLYYNMERLSHDEHVSSGSLDSCGFDLVHTPTRRKTGKETIDKKLLVDLLCFSWDAIVRSSGSEDDDAPSSQPCVVLLTSDGDYAYTLSKLRDRGVQTIVICGSSAGDGYSNNSILADVADVALSLEGDVLERESTTSTAITTPVSSLQKQLQFQKQRQEQQQQQQQQGGAFSDSTSITGNGDISSSAVIVAKQGNKDSSLMEYLITTFCRLIHERGKIHREDGDWQNYSQIADPLRRVIRQKVPKVTADQMKEITRQVRDKSVDLGLVRLGRRTLQPSSFLASERRPVVASAVKNYDKKKLSLEMYVALLPQGHAVALGKPSVGSTAGSPSASQALVLSSTTPSSGREDGTSSDTNALTPSSKAVMEVLVVDLVRIIQQQVGVSTNTDSWVDLGGVASRFHTIIRQRYTTYSSKKMNDMDVKEMARKLREQASSQGLICVGKRKLESGTGEGRQIIAISHKTRHLNLSGESYVCLLPKGEMRLAEPGPPESELEPSSDEERQLVVRTTSPTSTKTDGVISYLEMASKPATPMSTETAAEAAGGGTPAASPTSISELCLVLCRIVHERASGPQAAGSGWVDLGETLQQLQKLMRGSSRYSSDDIKEKARVVKVETLKRGLVENGRQVLRGFDYDYNMSDKEIVPLSKDDKYQYSHLKLGHYFLRLLDKGERFVVDNEDRAVSLSVESFSQERQSSSSADIVLALLRAVRHFAASTDRWACLGSVIGKVQAAIRNARIARSSDEVKELSRSFREQAVEKGLVEIGRRRLDTTGLGGAREIILFNSVKTTDPTLSSESYMRLTSKGQEVLQFGKQKDLEAESPPPTTLAETSRQEATRVDTRGLSALEEANNTSCVVTCRNLPASTEVGDLVSFVQNTFPVTVCRALVEGNGIMSNATVELLHESEAAMLIEEARKPPGYSVMVFQNRPMSVTSSNNAAALDAKGSSGVYYEAGVSALVGNAEATQQLTQPDPSMLKDDTLDTSLDVALFCVALLSLEDKPGRDPNGWLNAASIGLEFRALLPRVQSQVTSKEEASLRFQTAKTKAVESGLIEIGRRRQGERQAIVTVPLSHRPSGFFTLEVFFRLLPPGRSIASESKPSGQPANEAVVREWCNETMSATKRIFMNNIPASTTREQLYDFILNTFGCVAVGINLRGSHWEEEDVQCAHVQLEDAAAAAKILRTAKIPPGVVFCGRFIYTVEDKYPELGQIQTPAKNTMNGEDILLLAQSHTETSPNASSLEQED